MSSLFSRQFERRLALLWLGLSLLALALLLQFDPQASDSLWPACPWFRLTGLYCPGCGSTRAIYALLHADPAQALRMNALLVLALPLLPLLLWPAAAECAGAGLAQLQQRLRSPRLWLLLLLGFALLRNLPGMALLAPASG